MSGDHSPQSCASCAQADCSMSYLRQGKSPQATGRTAWILDEVWPEYRAYLAVEKQVGDQILAPGFLGRAGVRRYGWGQPVSHVGSLATLRRHLTLHRVRGKKGRERQAAYLAEDNRMAAALAPHLDYRADHLVIDQKFLPWFARSGLLGGRSYDVLMVRYPLAELHRLLDGLADAQEASATIGDFRADDDLAAQETAALAAARQIVTPHHGVAGLFGSQVRLLDWQAPSASPARTSGRVAFLGPTIARQGAHRVRAIARQLPEPLVLFGTDLEGADFWDGVVVERRQMGQDWLADIGAILHPAAMTNQPRRLLEAWGQGIGIYATSGCGLPPSHYRPFDSFSPA
ncbi:hypothetical protein ACFSM5_00385 [Lacibacterium aquatile]|uniref:Glycosyltransferase family 1 protein n=1 Tax=Lacibacterium aquatile TaxID=1168082 RepID=A0ABW5DLJ6_9PROT